MDQIAVEVRNILEILGIPKAIVIGHSMGGYVAMAFADRYPKMLAGLVMFNSHAAADNDETARNRDRTIDLIEKDKLGFISGFIPDLFAPDNVKKFNAEIEEHIKIASETSKEGIIASLRGMKERPDRTAVLNSLRIPVLVIAGKYDKRIPVDMLVSQIDNPDHVVMAILEGSGHMGFIEEEETAYKILEDFIESIYN